MANIYPVAGMKIYIGNVMTLSSSDYVATDFTSVHASPDSWVQIDGWTTMGTLGDSANLITTQLINRGRDLHQKGTANAGSMQNVFAYIASDPGQIALIAAGVGSNKSNYAFRIDGNESGVSAVSRRYFAALVMGTPEAGGGANTIDNLTVTLQINSNIVQVAATP